MLAGVGFGALAALALGPSFVASSLTPIIDLAADSRILPETIARTLYSVFAIGITVIALNRALLNGRKLMYAMATDGNLPDRIRTASSGSGSTAWLSLIFPIAGALLILLVSVEVLVGLAALTFLWAIGLVHLPDLIRSRPNLPATKLPFHPIFPGLSSAIGFMLPFAAGLQIALAGLAWLAVGGLYYILYGRQRGLEVRRKQIVVSEKSAEIEAKPGYRVMADITRANTPKR